MAERGTSGGTPEMTKVELRAPDGDSETLWATPVGADLYRLENSPFFAYDVSYEDVVEARVPHDDPGAFPLFVRVHERSGNRTLRLILDPPTSESTESQAVLDALARLGATFEGFNSAYFSITVPASVDLDAVAVYLESSGRRWEYADPTFADVYGNDESSVRQPEEEEPA